MTRVRVSLGDRSYEIHIGSGSLAGLGKRLHGLGFSGCLALVSNSRVFGLYGGAVLESLQAAGYKTQVFKVPDGEQYKTLEWANRLYGKFLAARLDRQSGVVALGGGVIGDLAGFVAATYMRGISLVQVPTTLLAQVDSSVGGKTAVNHPLGKNMIGVFFQPRLVWIDTDTLRTLPDREFRAGMAEVIKYGVITGARFFRYLERNMEGIMAREPKVLRHIIRRSCEIKAGVVAKDEQEETGYRAVLNYGHTAGHAIETLTGYTRYRHGEAIAMGMAAAARISHQMSLCGEKDVKRQEALLQRAGLPVLMPPLSWSQVRQAMSVDKKAVSGKIRFVLGRIGSLKVRDDVSPTVVRAALIALGH